MRFFTRKVPNTKCHILYSELAADGKSFVNPPADKKSPAYTQFTSPITSGSRGGFDIHIYYLQTDASQTTFAKELWARIRRECKSCPGFLYYAGLYILSSTITRSNEGYKKGKKKT